PARIRRFTGKTKALPEICLPLEYGDTLPQGVPIRGVAPETRTNPLVEMRKIPGRALRETCLILLILSELPTPCRHPDMFNRFPLTIPAA
ncbi:MAG: hypothetical protein ABIF87_11930, partial [Pseudomonadota bacterium]